MKLFKFSQSNSKLAKLSKKLKRKVVSFSTLSGHDCPFAKDCKSMVVDGKVVDGPHTEFRCFSASEEALYPVLFKARKYNSDLMKEMIIKGEAQLANRLNDSIPAKAEVIRIDVAGDFKTQRVFNAWLRVAHMNPNRLFYAYTKSLPFWVKQIGNIPDNMVLTASRGGKRDDLIDKHGLREAVVVYYSTDAEARANGYDGPTAESLGLEIDEDDSHAANPDTREQSFALLIHGVQPKGSDASKANYFHRKNKK